MAALPLLIARFPTPAAAQPRRNVFAFSVEERRPPRLSPAPFEVQASVPIVDERNETRPPDPPSPYRYLGSFGPQSTPILVFKGNGDVVNVYLAEMARPKP